MPAKIVTSKKFGRASGFGMLAIWGGQNGNPRSIEAFSPQPPSPRGSSTAMQHSNGHRENSREGLASSRHRRTMEVRQRKPGVGHRTTLKRLEDLVNGRRKQGWSPLRRVPGVIRSAAHFRPYNRVTVGPHTRHAHRRLRHHRADRGPARATWPRRSAARRFNRATASPIGKPIRCSKNWPTPRWTARARSSSRT